MTVNISIELHPDRGPLDTQLDQAMLALGYEPRTPTLREIAHAAHDAGIKIDFAVEKPVDPEAMTEVCEKIAETQVNAPKPTRERGKPSPGHARRTKEEIAEDKATDEANAALKTAGEETGAIVPDKQVDERPLISTDPENRVGPEDTPEDQAQDAADEAAETAAAKAETGNKPTLDDIRTVLGNYQKVYGLPATMEDGPVVIGEVVAGAKKVSDVPEDKIADVVAALKAAGKTNRFQRAVVQS